MLAGFAAALTISPVPDCVRACHLEEDLPNGDFKHPRQRELADPTRMQGPQDQVLERGEGRRCRFPGRFVLLGDQIDKRCLRERFLEWANNLDFALDSAFLSAVVFGAGFLGAGLAIAMSLFL